MSGQSGTDDRVRDAGYDDLLDAVEAGDGYFLECSNGHGTLPPRRVCPHCGDTALSEEPLAETGTVRTHTVVHVPTPAFEGDAPYTTAVADFDGVSLTGVVWETDGVETGQDVTVDVDDRDDGSRLLVFHPQ